CRSSCWPPRRRRPHRSIVIVVYESADGPSTGGGGWFAAGTATNCQTPARASTGMSSPEPTLSHLIRNLQCSPPPRSLLSCCSALPALVGGPTAPRVLLALPGRKARPVRPVPWALRAPSVLQDPSARRAH